MTLSEDNVLKDQDFLSALDLIWKKVGAARNLPGISLVEDKERLRFYEHELKKKDDLICKLTTELASLKVSTPLTAPSLNDFILDCRQKNNPHLHAYLHNFKPEAWEHKLDEHAKVMVAMLKDLSGLKIDGIVASQGEYLDTVEYLVNCSLTVH
ncbi:hypothetical protein Moror_12944 [Moniliophthora roreri MCA 2997]|uniref:Uncharacterized protein n=1 Tax=Moniliophthora roreri (strain MCA 2997) TaxID=1381753 RepID=V2XM68_MONRO|nr:hypothetical protein Moror_12944 [Moniliophthora roreri MCA 2997]